MAEYIFDRGMFLRWGVPMWAGETRALKLVRLLVKQGYKGIRYEEGPLRGYEYHDICKPYRYIRPLWERVDADKILSRIRWTDRQAPKWFKVTF